ncbi:hypothetical protein [Raoultella ornithinolytica]|uniref:hypothetical protein n=1 Tax=Raoultella ornithinolytica TaxID=54291 RepID=UPI001D1857F7|nr:hypothetical protein [Raoultella ornithinolytica]
MTNNQLTDEPRVLAYVERLKAAATVYLDVSAKDVPFYDKAVARRPFDLLLHPSDLLILIASYEAKEVELQERRKAAMDSEPVAWTDEEELRDVERSGCGYLFTLNPVTPHADERRIILLYRRAQQPVVPEEKPMPNPLSMYAVDAVAAIAEVRGWNACRAAMLAAAPPAPKSD